MAITFLWPWSGNFRPYVLEKGSSEFLSWTRARPTDVRHVTLEMNVAMQPYYDVSDFTSLCRHYFSPYQLWASGHDSTGELTAFYKNFINTKEASFHLGLKFRQDLITSLVKR